ncbi:MAG: cyclodeaminase/cyclohydrolase family protein [Oscillospiraceae bacterium]|nr:cyclodeaminase/cyclohydrolase family protein [Oscillospiraceae bacterium]
MESLNRGILEFCAALASPSPVPGGGGASALAGALGAALGSMVGELTIGKKKYADVEADVRSLMARAQELRSRLVECIERDAELFEPLAGAYAIPKDAPGRDETMERCLRDAASVPMEVFDLCCECIELQKGFAEKGSRLMISDAATGAALSRGALEGAAVNVRVNTRLMKDREYARRLDDHVEKGLNKYRALAEEVYVLVWNKLSAENA